MKTKEEYNRRSFLKHVLTGTAVAGTAAIARPAKVNSAPMLNCADDKLYHESENFRKYYETLRS